MINKKYKMYVFDLDGTLVDTRVDIARALQVTMQRAGLSEATLEQVLAAIGGGAKNAVRTLTGLDGDELEKQLEFFMQQYIKMCTDNATIYEGGLELLQRLKQQGAILAMVTMKARIPTHNIIKALSLSMFDDVITFDDVEHRKPNPHSMEQLLSKHELNPSDVLMIGDTVTDMKYAKASGVDVCAMTFGYGITEEVIAQKPTYILNSYADF